MLFLVTYFVSVVWTFTLLLAEERIPIRPEACIMPPPEGDCGGAQQDRWFFDANTGSCRRFLFQGCPGVGSTFETQEECQRICVDISAAEDSSEPQPEVNSSAETLSTFPVDPVNSNQHNAKLTTEGSLLVRTTEAKDTTPEITSSPPLTPSGIQKKPSGSVEVEATPVVAAGIQQAPNQKTTLPLPSEKVQDDVKSTSGQDKDFKEGSEKVEEDVNSTSGQMDKNFKEGSRTALKAQEKPQEPVAANRQPVPSFPDSDKTEKSRDLTTPLMATEGQQDPSNEKPSSDDDERGQTERSRPSADQDDDPEEPEMFHNPDRQTELEQEAVESLPKESPEEQNRGEETPDENPSFGTPRMPRMMPNNGEVGITSVLPTSMQSNTKELQREFTPKFIPASIGNTGTEQVQQENIDDQEPQDEIRLSIENPHEPVATNDEPAPSDRESDTPEKSRGLATPMMATKSDQSTSRNLEDSTQQRKINDETTKQTSPPETIAIQITNTVPLQSRTSVRGVGPVTRSSDGRVHSPSFDGAIRSDGSSEDPTKKEHVIGKEGGRNIEVTQHALETTAALLDSLAHPASVEASKAPRGLNMSNHSERSIHFKTAAQSPAANEPQPAARPFSMDGRIPQNRENPSTGGNMNIASGNPAVRPKFKAPPLRLSKSEHDYRRPAFCSLHKVRGHCPEQLIRWYFNPFNGSCQSFTYSGCGGNPNNFQTMDTCFVTCTGRRNADRSRAENSFQDGPPNSRTPSRFAEPKWLPAAAPLAELPPQQPEGLQFFLDMLRRKLPPPPPPPPFLRSLAFPPFRHESPGDNVADQKVLLGDTYIEDSGKPEEQRRARQSSASPDKRFHLLGKASRRSEEHEQLHKHQQQQQQRQQRQSVAQASRSSGFRAPHNLPEKATINSDIETLRNLFRHQPRESPVSVFDPIPFGRNPGTSSIQTSRRTTDDNTKADKRPEMDRPHLEERHPAVQRTRSRQNRQSPDIGFQRFGHFLNNNNNNNDNGRPPMSQELKNFRWIEQAIVVSDVEPGRLNLPFWFDGEEMMERPRPSPGQTSNYRDSAGPRTDGSPPNAMTLRRNSVIFETRQRPKKPQDFEMEKRLSSRDSYDTANALLPHAMKPDRMAISFDRSGLPRQSQNQLHPSFSTSHRGFPARGKGNSEIPFHVLHPSRPLAEQLAVGRTGVDRVEQDSRRSSHADEDNNRKEFREDGRAERPNVMGRDMNWQEQDKERPAQRRRNNNNGFSSSSSSSSRSSPSDRLTFLQIFVDGDQFSRPVDQPHFTKPSPEENQYFRQNRLSLPRSQIEAPRFQTIQNGGYFPPPPPPPRQMSPRQRPVQISRDPMTDERDWSPASEFDGPRSNRDFVNSRSGSLGSVLNEDLKERRRGNPVSSVCKLPLEPGSCAGYQAKWFYNRRKGSCELFYYGGCSGNGNRFDTRDECLQTCDGGSDPRSDDMESRSLNDNFGRRPESEMSSEDVLILTSPVYGDVDERSKDSATVKVKYAGYDHVGRPQLTTNVPFLSGHGKRVELESHDPLDAQVDGKATERTTTAGKSAITELAGKDGATGESKKDDDLSKTFSTQYIAIVTALGVVGIAVVLMVILSIIRLCRRVKKSKREHCIQEVIKSHMYGDLPHVIYSESSSSAESEKGKPDKK